NHEEEAPKGDLLASGASAETSAENPQQQQQANAAASQDNSDAQQTNAERLSVTRNYIQRIWKEASPQEHLMLAFTFVISLSTFLYMMFAGWQLYEIHSSSVDTHALAVAAKAQADATQKELDLWDRPWLSVKAGIIGPLT